MNGLPLDEQLGSPNKIGVLMRKTLLCSCFLLLLAPAAAMAQQDYPRGEVFFGYSYFRANPEGQNLNGWNASVAGNITSWFGVEGDFAGHYGTLKDQFGFIIQGIQINQYTFMGGPKLSLRGGRVAPFVHALIGGARAGTDEFGLKSSGFALAAAVGGGIDIGLNKSFAVRAVQADYLMTRFKSFPEFRNFSVDERQNNFRFSTGIVVRF
jgi:hypothetical protein